MTVTDVMAENFPSVDKEFYIQKNTCKCSSKQPWLNKIKRIHIITTIKLSPRR